MSLASSEKFRVKNSLVCDDGWLVDVVIAAVNYVDVDITLVFSS